MSADVLILPVIRVESVDGNAQIIQVMLSRQVFARLTNRAVQLGVRQDEAAAAIIERALDPKRRP